MASWGVARRVAESCASSVAGGVTGARASTARRVSTTIGYVRLPAFQRLTLHPSSYRPTSSSAFLPSTPCASLSENNVGFRRPEEIPWQKDLANNVHLIGNINRNVVIKYLDSGKIVTSTSIKVKRTVPSNGEGDTVFALQFWDELAEVAAAHLKMEDRVYIAGSVWVENYEQDNLQRSICKVVAKDLKFVGLDYRATNDGNSRVDEQPTQFLSIEDQWKDYFQNPSDYWDNRIGKKNPRGPDFKHKSTGIGLWIEDKKIPSWVSDRLEQRGSEVEGNFESQSKGAKLKEAEKLWQAFFANPLDWWDNRDTKRNVKQPDFKNKSTSEVLWVDGYNNPVWVKSQLSAMDLKAKSAKEGVGRISGSKDKAAKSSFADEDFGLF